MLALGYSTHEKPASLVFKLLPYFLLFIAIVSYSIEEGEFELIALSLLFLFLILHSLLAIDAKGPPSVDFEPQAKALFEKLAQNYSLSAEFTEDHALCCTFPIQEQLKEEVWMCFQNSDEINFGVGNFFVGSAFHCPRAFKEFEKSMSGILSGEYRIRYNRFGAVLEEPNGDTWILRSQYNWQPRPLHHGSDKSGFDEVIFQNTPIAT